MLDCYQFERMNMLQHGQAVHEKYKLLISELQGEQTSLHQTLPAIFNDQSFKDWLLGSQLPMETMRLYHWYHDCGKGDCLTVDESGKRHFPDHAAISSAKFLKHASGVLQAETIAKLIAMDMDFHTKRCGELDELCKHELAPSLYLTALAEIYANSEMFGGTSSTSFKIKHKWLSKAGKKLAQANEVCHGK